jgi:hypothetical protein
MRVLSAGRAPLLLALVAAGAPGCVWYGSQSMTRAWADHNTLDRPAFYVERLSHGPYPRERVERFRWMYGVPVGGPSAMSGPGFIVPGHWSVPSLPDMPDMDWPGSAAFGGGSRGGLAPGAAGPGSTPPIPPGTLSPGAPGPGATLPGAALPGAPGGAAPGAAPHGTGLFGMKPLFAPRVGTEPGACDVECDAGCDEGSPPRRPFASLFGRVNNNEARSDRREAAEVRCIERQKMREWQTATRRASCTCLPMTAACATTAFHAGYMSGVSGSIRNADSNPAAFRSASAAVNPSPLEEAGRVATLRNSIRFCGVTWITSPRRCSSVTASTAEA